MSTLARVEAFVVSQKLRRSFHFSQWGYDRRTVCLVRVTAVDGRVAVPDAPGLGVDLDLRRLPDFAGATT